jgi:branched-chain amino acid transport system permease protein
LSFVGAVLVFGFLAALPLWGSAYALQLATDILTFTILAYSWNLISGFTGYLSFGQVSFYGLGAYTTALIVLHTPTPWYAAVLAAGLVSGLSACILGALMLRLHGIMFALGMAGLARILAVAVSDWEFAGDSVGITLPAQLTPVSVYLAMLAVALAAFALNFWFTRSGFGLDAMSVRDDEEAASSLGVPGMRVKASVFVLSAVLPAVAGGLVAWNRSYIDPSSAFDSTIDLQTVVFVLFGGIATLWGPLIGTCVLMLLGEQFLVHFPDLELALFGALVIIIVLVLPGGLVALANRFGWLLPPLMLAPRALPAGKRPRRREGTSDRPVLDVDQLSVRFGGVCALDRVSMQVKPGETISVIGANGAGKTTLFHTISGLIAPSSGDIRYRGQSLVGVPPFRRAQSGIARTFQIPRLMETMSVWENVVLATRHGNQSGRMIEHTAWAIRSVGLGELWRSPVNTLTPGLRRRLEVARALALDPDLILLDEVMAGMTRHEQEDIRQVLRGLRELGVAVIAVEHVIAAVADLSDRIMVLDFGRVIATGPPEAVLNDAAVLRAYLGEAQ